MSGIGNIQGSLNTGNAATNYQCPLGDRHGDGGKYPVLFDPLHQHANDLNCFQGGFFTVFMYPGTVLTDVGHFTQKRVQAGLFYRFAEGTLVHPGRTGGHHNLRQTMLNDCIFHQVLAGVGAHVFVVGGKSHTRHLCRLSRHLLDIHRAGDVLTAMTNKNTNSGHLGILRRD